ncbi:TonB family protein [Sphingomonas sp. HF-S3]|uniref:TonB family protein n=1 Tax=Sphingomonas rustica TaxID=3103142 RepID=A0ABV0B9K3_9SPHN
MGLLRYSHVLASLVIGAPLIPGAAMAQSRHELIIIGEAPIGADPDLLRPVSILGDRKTWVTNDDYPAEAKRAGETGSMLIRVSTDDRGRVSDCVLMTHDTSPALNQTACRLVRERGKFRHALSSEGKPVASSITLYVSFVLEERGIPTVSPGAPPRGKYEQTLRLVSDPDWSAASPTDNPSGNVVITISASPDGDGQLRAGYCHVTESSGDRRLDAATCNVAKAARYEPIAPNLPDDKLLQLRILVRWSHGMARHELPSRPSGTPAAIQGGREALLAAAAAGTVSENGVVAAVLGPDGKIRCRILRSLGSDETDRAVCQYLQSKVSFKPAEDVFGRKVLETQYLEFDP